MLLIGGIYILFYKKKEDSYGKSIIPSRFNQPETF
jgi:hypothetical protein